MPVARQGNAVIKIRQVLSADFADALRAVHRRRQPEILAAAVAAAVLRGWTLKAMADALGLSRERLRQIAQGAPEGLASAVEIPEPPRTPEPVKRCVPTLTAEQADHLRVLLECGGAGGRYPFDHPKTVARRELAGLVNGYLKIGHKMGELSAVLGISQTAIHVRLARRGYRRLPPSLRRNGRKAAPAASDAVPH